MLGFICSLYVVPNPYRINFCAGHEVWFEIHFFLANGYLIILAHFFAKIMIFSLITFKLLKVLIQEIML